MVKEKDIEFSILQSNNPEIYGIFACSTKCGVLIVQDRKATCKVDGKIIYKAPIKGVNEFIDDEERTYIIGAARIYVLEHLNKDLGVLTNDEFTEFISELENKLKECNVSYCHTYHKLTKNNPTVLYITMKTDSLQNVNKIKGFLNIYKYKYCIVETLDRNVDMDAYLLYKNTLGLRTDCIDYGTPTSALERMAEMASK